MDEKSFPMLLIAGALVALVFLRRRDQNRNMAVSEGSMIWPVYQGATYNETARGYVPTPIAPTPGQVQRLPDGGWLI